MNSENEIAGESSVALGKGGDSSTDDAVETSILRAGPDRAVAVFVNDADRFSGEFERVGSECSVHDALKSARRPDPQDAAAVFIQRQHHIVMETVLRIVNRGVSLEDAIQPAVERAHPQAAVAAVQRGHDEVARQSAAFAEVAAVESLNAFSGTDPQRTIGIGVHCPHLVAQQSLRGGEGDDCPQRDAAQTTCRPDPEVAVAILEE